MRSLLSAVRPLAQLVGRAAMVQAREVGVMAALAAMGPLGDSARGFERVVDALPPIGPNPVPTTAATRREPSRRQELAQQRDLSKRPVLLVHGFAGTRSCWFALAGALRARGVTVDAISYSPFGTSVEQLAGQLADRVGELLARTGADRVHLVGHSMGGVIIAQAFADGRLAGQVDTVVTIATPFGGSPWATLCPIGEVVRSLRAGSPLLRRLATATAPEGVRWLAFTAARDVVVPGHRSVPVHHNVARVTIDDVGHVGMLLNQQVVSSIVAALPAPETAA